MENVYSDTPWVMPPDIPEVREMFRAKGKRMVFRRRENLNLGGEHKVYFLESGIIATFAGGIGNFERMVGIFTAGGTLGAVKAVSHRGRTMPLRARVFAEAEALFLDTVAFRRELERDKDVYARAAVSFIRKDEASIEGLLLNDLLKIPERLALMIKVAFEVSGTALTDEFQPLPPAFSVTDIATMVHCTRVAASKTLALWNRQGIIRRDGADWLFSRELLEIV